MYLKETERNGIVFEFRLNLVQRHLCHLSTHGLGQSEAREKKEQAQEDVRTAMAAAMADTFIGTFNIFNRPSFQHFLHVSNEYAKNYRQNPDTFLSFSRNSVARLVANRSETMMGYFKEAVTQSIQQEQEALRKLMDECELDECDLNFKDIPRVVFSIFMDFKWFGTLKQNLGAVTMAGRIYDTEKDEWKTLIEIPLELFSLDEDGSTAKANARHFKRVVEEFFKKEHIRFLGAAFDGGIIDKNKSNLLPILAASGYENFETTSFSCSCHGNALQPPLSVKRVFIPFQLSLESEAKSEPNPQIGPQRPKDSLSRDSAESIWFGNGDEKAKNEKNIRTFHCIMKELGKRSKKRQWNYGDYVEVLRFQDDRNKETPSRTNSTFLRWKSYYFKTEPELPDECPLKIIRMNDKKLRKLHQKVIRLLDNWHYIQLAFKHEDYRKFFPDDADMDGDFLNMLGQWAGLVTCLWTLNDSSKEGNNCSTFRSLLIVLKAILEDDALDNFLLRYFIITFLNLF